MRRLILSLVLLLPLSCKSVNSTDSGVSSFATSADFKEIPGQNDYDSTVEFRDIFATLAQSSYQPEAIQKLILLAPPEAIATRPHGTNARDALLNLRFDTLKYRPTDFYAQGVKTPITPQNNVHDALQKTGPITFVIIPGLTTEFVATYPFDKIVTNANSALAKKFAAALANASDANAKTDLSFDFESLQDRPKALSDLFRVGSIDDANGNALANYIVLAAPMFSGESFGPYDENAARYMQHIDKYFALMGVPDNLILLGQSRGSPVVTQMLADLAANPRPWAKNLKGMVSLAGINLGTPIADAVFDPEDPLHDVLGKIAQLARDLEVRTDQTSTLEDIAMRARNTARWVKAGAEAGAAALKLPAHPGQELEKIQPAGAPINPLVKLLVDVSFKKFNFANPANSNHFENVKKFKWLILRLVTAIDNLRTTTRIEWYKSHTLPANIKYFAVGAVMGDVSTQERGVSTLTGNPYSYNTKANDYFLLRYNYYEMYRISKAELNDGLASWERARFYPAFLNATNPSQKAFRSYYLGTMDVDHFGLGFSEALPTSGGIRSPFPAPILGEAIAVFVARHLND